MLWWHKKYTWGEAYLWRVEESPAFFAHRLSLSDAEWTALVQRHSHLQSLTDWLSSRYLLLQVLGTADYQCLAMTETGKWYVSGRDDIHFSISHSQGVAAIAIAHTPVGVDIQAQTERLTRIAPKYIPSALLATWQGQPRYSDLLHIHWGAKEAMFKAWGRGGLDFRAHLHVGEVAWRGGGGRCPLSVGQITRRAATLYPKHRTNRTILVVYNSRKAFYILRVCLGIKFGAEKCSFCPKLHQKYSPMRCIASVFWLIWNKKPYFVAIQI